MNTQSFYTRKMLLQYGKQLVAARRLARYEKAIGKVREQDQEVIHARRKAMVERIAGEIVENLIFSGSDNPVVREVKDALAAVLEERYIFKYPPGDTDFQIYKVTPGGEVEVSDDERHEVMSKLWEITLRTVNSTML